MHPSARIVAALVLATALSSHVLAQPTFTPIEIGNVSSDPVKMSADSSTVALQVIDNTVGQYRSMLWTAAGGIRSLNTVLGLPSGQTGTSCNGISADGQALTGVAYFAGLRRGYRWTAASGLTELPFEGNAISSDGNAVAGGGSVVFEGPQHAFRWTLENGTQDIGKLPGGFRAVATAISADGSVVAGYASIISNYPDHPFRWTSGGGMQDLGVPAGAVTSWTFGISGDGLVVVGSCDYPGGVRHATRWTSASGIQDLGALPATAALSHSYAANWDGSVVVGASTAPNGNGFHAFMWTPVDGMVDLNTYLPTLGVDLTGWVLSEATAVSADASTIAGIGFHGEGERRAWIVTDLPPITPPCVADVGGQGGVPGDDGVLDNNDFILFISYFFVQDPIADRGMQGGVYGSDGLYNNNDFIVFIDQFFAGCP